MKKNLLEIACFNYESALIAAAAGASRIEFCEDYASGGVTPSLTLVKQIKESIHIPVFVMIRPRGGNFIYTNEEFATMKAQVVFCKENHLDGVVFGMLTTENRIDEERCKELVQLAQPMACTFHRAFDEADHTIDALEAVIRCGFQRILSSGGKVTAMDGAINLQQLIQQAGDRIIILPGGGIRPDNIATIKDLTSATEFHSAALLKNQDVADAVIIQALLQQL